jgi:hypothetical protein
MTNNLIRRRACAVSAAVSLLGAAVLAGAPTASADEVIDLDNGLTVKITAPNPDLREIAVYPTDGEVHFRLPNEQQIDGTHLTHITRSQTPVRIQSCWKPVFTVSSNCRPWSTIDPFKYDAPPSPPPPGQSPVELCPAGSKTRTVPAGQQCEAEPKPDVQCPPDSPVKTVPAGQTCPPPPLVTDAITLSFAPPKIITLIPPSASITATVSNSSDLTAKCTYDATPDFDSHRDFTVNPHRSTDLTFNGVATGTNYHVVVSCHDASGKQTQEIGGAVTDQPF